MPSPVQALPNLTRSFVELLLFRNNLALSDYKIVLVGIKNYYEKFLDIQNRMFYNDALIIVTKANLFAFTFNADASTYNIGVKNLVSGIYDVHKYGYRNKYDVFKIVNRNHGINFYCESLSKIKTFSFQVLPKEQFLVFKKIVYNFMNDYKLNEIKYLLLDL